MESCGWSQDDMATPILIKTFRILQTHGGKSNAGGWREGREGAVVESCKPAAGTLRQI